MSSSDYINADEFRDYIQSSGTGTSGSISAAITAASRAVDAHCDRTFYIDEAAVRYFSNDPYDGRGLWYLEIDDLADVTDLEVLIDGSGNGTYSTELAVNTDFVLEPRNQRFGSIAGYPYTALRATSGTAFPIRSTAWQPDTVKITGNFGWAAVPAPVKQAAKIVAAQLWKLGEAPFGVAGWGDYGMIRVRDIPQAASLLAPYRRGSSFGIA
jgi:hypothetical protein